MPNVLHWSRNRTALQKGIIPEDNPLPLPLFKHSSQEDGHAGDGENGGVQAQRVAAEV